MMKVSHRPDRTALEKYCVDVELFKTCNFFLNIPTRDRMSNNLYDHQHEYPVNKLFKSSRSDFFHLIRSDKTNRLLGSNLPSPRRKKR